jgi:hypothetical protein
VTIGVTAGSVELRQSVDTQIWPLVRRGDVKSTGPGLTVSVVALLAYVFMNGRNGQRGDPSQKASALSAQQELPFRIAA